MTPMAQKTYELLKKVPRGRVTTYKALANALGTRGYRTIGQILRNNPYAPEVPCHRVVASDGTIGGFMGKTSGIMIKKKMELLQKEGIHFSERQVLDFKKVFFRFKTAGIDKLNKKEL
jgi:methylated-DNA-[protein]-cysteine S-methyltransferase